MSYGLKQTKVVNFTADRGPFFTCRVQPLREFNIMPQ